MRATDRVTLDGHRFDRRTADLITQARTLSGVTGRISQGAYAAGYSKSAGTHDGGGAFDIITDSVEDAFRLNRWLRSCGAASWVREPHEGDWPLHIHGLDIGCATLSDAARRQVQDYYAGRNGLVNRAKDTAWRPNPILPLVWPLRGVNLRRVRAEAEKTKGWQKMPGVVRLQRALNRKSGAGLTVDGIFGPATRAAYARFEVDCDGDGDGLPGLWALQVLSAGQFKVVE